MAMEQVVAFLLFSLVAAATPGPSNVMLTTAGANVGLLKGLPCLLGVVTGVGLMMFLVPLGLGSLVLQNPLLLRALNWCGAIFLLWLSWKIATASPLQPSTPKSDPVGFIGAAVFQWINPKAWIVTASAAGTFLQAKAGRPVEQAAFLCGLFCLAALPSCFLWLAFGATIQRFLKNRRSLKAFNIAMGTILALSVALIVW